MSIFVLVMLILIFYGIQINKDGFSDYMSPQKSNSIKGFFVLMVLLSHSRKFVKIDSSPINEPFLELMSFFGQFMVVMFLLYSGYGIMLGLKNKEGYAKSILTKRFPKVLLHFDIAVILYFILGLLLGNNYSFKRLLLSLIGVNDVGNAVWFIFVTLVLYLLTFSVFTFCKKNVIIGAVIMSIVSIMLVFIIRKWKISEHWWYDTIMCFPLGMWYALVKPYIDKLLLNDFNKWFSFTATTGIIFYFLVYVMDNYGRRMRYFIPAALIFGVFILLLSMRISINNKILSWFGNHVFSIYILHYIPMKLLSYFKLNDNAFLFAAASLAITIIIAELFERAMNKTDTILRLNKK